MEPQNGTFPLDFQVATTVPRCICAERPSRFAHGFAHSPCCPVLGMVDGAAHRNCAFCASGGSVWRGCVSKSKQKCTFSTRTPADLPASENADRFWGLICCIVLCARSPFAGCGASGGRSRRVPARWLELTFSRPDTTISGICLLRFRQLFNGATYRIRRITRIVRVQRCSMGRCGPGQADRLTSVSYWT